MAEAEVMSGVENGKTEAVAVAKPKAPVRGRETQELLKRASEGDESCREAIRALLADGERGRSYVEPYGSSAEWLMRTIVEKAAGKHIAAQEAIVQKIESVQSELAGPNPTPLERLLAERAAICWMLVNWYENSALSVDNLSIRQAAYHLSKIDKAHARFLSAVRTLAQVRKLALPTLQLNIARNQVNVAEVRS
jgi:hypothetical protein